MLSSSQDIIDDVDKMVDISESYRCTPSSGDNFNALNFMSFSILATSLSINIINSNNNNNNNNNNVSEKTFYFLLLCGSRLDTKWCLAIRQKRWNAINTFNLMSFICFAFVTRNFVE